MKVLQNPDFYRPKTAFMLLAVLFSMLSVLFPFVDIYGTGYSLTDLVQYDAQPLKEALKSVIFEVQLAFSMAVVTGMIVVYGLTIPGERKKQMKFCNAGMVPPLVQLLLMYLSVSSLVGSINRLGFLFPLLIILALALAFVFLKKDEAKIKKMDRLWD